MASSRMFSGLWQFVSSFRLSLHWIWTAYTTFHTLCYRKKILIVCQKAINEFQMLWVGFKAVEIIQLCYGVPCWLNKMGFDLVNVCSNLVLVWAFNFQPEPLHQGTSFKISFVSASNAMDQMMFCCIVVFQYISTICQGVASANDFATCHIA